jgi:hypothetical protein
MINNMPVELEPPSPMQPPPLRRRPFISPHFNTKPNDPSSLRLFMSERWN